MGFILPFVNVYEISFSSKSQPKSVLKEKELIVELYVR